MSTRSVLFLAVLTAVLAAPAAIAQLPAHTLTIEIEDLPSSVESNGTQVSVPFTIRATVAGASPCFVTTSGTEYTIDLAAEVLNSTGNNTFATVNPKQVTIAGPVLLSASGQAERTEGAVLTISPGPYSGDALGALIQVTASFAGGNAGCPGTGATQAAEAEATVAAAFEPVQSSLYGGTGTGQEMPAPGAVLLMVALAAVVVGLRRKA
jgi:hypothetical protein